MPPTTTPGPCGCKVYHRHRSMVVEYCPVHGAAPEMLATIQRLARYEGPDAAFTRESMQARVLLAKVDGKDG